MDDCIADARRAIGHFRGLAAQRGLDSACLASGGSSAGAHLALVAAMIAPDRPVPAAHPGVAAVAALNPVVDLLAYPPGEQRTLEERVARVAAGTLGAYSPAEFVRAGNPPVLIQHGTDDKTAPIATPTSWVTGLMLVLELTVILVFTGFCLGHASLGSDPFTHPSLPATHGTGLIAVGAAGMISAIVPALFAFNGYDWPLYFAEESRGSRRALPRAVLLAGVISVVVEVLAVIAATYAIKDLPATSANAAPLSDIAARVMGSTGSTILLIGVVIAMFDTGLAGNLAYARIYYAAARDTMWPGPLNSFFGHLTRRTQVPVWGFAVLFAGNAILCVFSSLNDLITFTGVVIVLIYLMVAVSAVVCRVRERGSGQDGVFRMPLWPVPPLIAIAGVIVALTQQDARDLSIAFGIAIVSFIGYFIARRRLREAA
jgi:amino acid transporter